MRLSNQSDHCTECHNFNITRQETLQHIETHWYVCYSQKTENVMSTFNKGRNKKLYTAQGKLNMAIVVIVEGDRSSYFII